MRNDFEMGGYNVHEHNHADKEAWPDERLRIERERILELLQPWQGEERTRQLMARKALIEFEQDSRFPT